MKVAMISLVFERCAPGSKEDQAAGAGGDLKGSGGVPGGEPAQSFLWVLPGRSYGLRYVVVL